jgi:hypothetical protein
VYIHCRGGHGRSCLVITCLLYLLHDEFITRDAIEHTIRIHNTRSDLSARWKTIKSPFSKTQYIFLYKFLNPICILKSYNTGYQAGFSGSSSFTIENKYGSFSNIDSAFQIIKSSEEVISNEELMLSLTQDKFSQHPELQENLIATGIKKIYDLSRYAFGGNLIGRCLVTVRNKYLYDKLF